MLVSTSIGSTFLDKKKKLSLASNATVFELKEQLQQKFPGSPPIIIQRLFFGLRKLSDTDVVGNLTKLSPIPLLLDAMSGTSVYEKASLSVSQLIEAYVASIVQQAYLNDMIVQNFRSSGGEGSSETMITTTYRDMFNYINQTIYETYAEDIRLALEEEREPEILAADTSAWRSDGKSHSPIAKALAKEFDLNVRGIKSFIYYSLVLGVSVTSIFAFLFNLCTQMFAWFGTNGETSTNFLLALVPVLWISKLRQLRLLYKVDYCISKCF